MTLLFQFGLIPIIGCSQGLESKTIHFTADTEVTEDTATQWGDTRATGTTIDTELYETGQATNPEDARTRYPSGWVHSPITESVIQEMVAILSGQSAPALDVFMKVGDSITYSSYYLHCFADSDVDLGGRTDLQETLDFYRAGDAAGTTPFDRWSDVVLGGKTASWAIDGDPSPLEQEITSIEPSTAVIMFGTNDSSYYSDDAPRMLRWYGSEMLTLTDEMIDASVVPLFMTIPPSESSTIGPRVGLINAVVRGIAQGLQVPLIDYQLVMMQAPDWGLSSDGVHPNATGDGCDLTKEGLESGYNLRNLVTLQSLDRARMALDVEPVALDDVQPLSSGDGSPGDPIRIDELPFTRMSNTTFSEYRQIDGYPECDTGQDESGAEEYFSLHLDEQTALRIAVVDRDGVDVDIHLLAEDSDSCLRRDDTLIAGTLSAGDYRVVVDTYVSTGVELSGEYLLVAVPCEPDDVDCEELIL